MTPATARETRAAIAPAAQGVAAAPARRASPAPPAPRSGRVARQLGRDSLQRAAWTISRTGRPGLAGLALLAAAGVFLGSTHLKVREEVAGLRVALATASAQALAGATEGGAPDPADPAVALRLLPARAQLPAQLRALFEGAARAKLQVDTARYEASALQSTGVVKYQVAFPVTGPYPAIRAFIDATLATMPSVALTELAIDRRAIGDGEVEARLRWTVFLRGEP